MAGQAATAKVTIIDVAAHAGVSTKTVSRVINREPNVSQAMQQKVEQAIAQLRYRPNAAARNLASSRSRLIALVFDDPRAYEIPSSGYIVEMQLGALRACQRENYDLLIHPCRVREPGVGAELRTMIEHVRPHGIILAAPLSNTLQAVRAVEASGTRVVRLSPGASRRGLASVSTNDREISASMTRYLASLGHEHIAFIMGDRRHKAVANRYLGYRDGLAQAGLKFSQSWAAQGDNSFLSGAEAATRLLALDPVPTAIFAANDDMAAGVMRTAHLRGIDIPGKLSVAGFDDIPLARMIYPALTTIRQPLALMADRAVQVLLSADSCGAPASGPIIVPAELQIRGSTGPAPAR